jgi:hypothetical protein
MAIEYIEFKIDTASSGGQTNVTVPTLVTDNGGKEGLLVFSETGIFQHTFTLSQDTSVFIDVQIAPANDMPTFLLVNGSRTIDSITKNDDDDDYTLGVTLSDDSSLDTSEILLTTWTSDHYVDKKPVTFNRWFPAGTILTLAYDIPSTTPEYDREGFQAYLNPSDSLTIENIPLNGFILDSTLNDNLNLFTGSLVKDCDCTRATMDGADFSGCQFINCNMNQAFLKNIITDATTEFDKESLAGLQLNISGSNITIPEAYQVVEGYVCGPSSNLSNLGDLLQDAGLDIDIGGAHVAGTNLASLDARKQSSTLNAISYSPVQTISAENTRYDSIYAMNKMSGDGTSIFILDNSGKLNVYTREHPDSEYAYDSTIILVVTSLWFVSNDGKVVGVGTTNSSVPSLWEKSDNGWISNQEFQEGLHSIFPPDESGDYDFTLYSHPMTNGEKVVVRTYSNDEEKIVLFSRTNGFTTPMDDISIDYTRNDNWRLVTGGDFFAVTHLQQQDSLTGVVEVYSTSGNIITLLHTIPYRERRGGFGVDIQFSEDGTKLMVSCYSADTNGHNSKRLDYFETNDGWQSYTETRDVFPSRSLLGTELFRTAHLSPDGNVILLHGVSSDISDLPITRLEYNDGQWIVANTIFPPLRLDDSGDSIAYDYILAVDPSADTLLLSYADNIHVVYKYGAEPTLSPTQDMTANGFLISTGDLSDTFEASNYAAFLSSENKLNEAFLKDVADLKPARPVVFGSDFLDAISSLTFAPNVQVITAKHGPRQWNDEIYVGYIILESGESFKFQNISTSLRRTLDGVYEIYEGDEFQRILSQGQLYSSDTLDIAFGSIIVIARISLRDICFAKGSIVETDQGPTRIERIRPWYHTIDGEVIDKLVQSLCVFPSVVQIEKDALGENYPNRLTVVTPNHKIEYKGNMLHAGLLRHLPGVRLIDSNQRRMYNIFLKEYSFMKVNNLKAETLYPESLYKLQNTMV